MPAPATQIIVGIRVRPLAERDTLPSSLRYDRRVIYDDEAERSWKFDHVWTDGVTNETIYGNVAAPIVAGVVDGYNGTVFAYGQTSSVSASAGASPCVARVVSGGAGVQGKTYTLTGTSADPGLTPRSIRNLFDLLYSSGLEFMVRVSYIEIYNEEVNDLLRPENTCLKLFEDATVGSYVKDLTEVAVCTMEDAVKLMLRGNEFRHVSSTAMNAKSSRSHTLFRMAVETRGDRARAAADTDSVVTDDDDTGSITSFRDDARSTETPKAQGKGGTRSHTHSHHTRHIRAHSRVFVQARSQRCACRTSISLTSPAASGSRRRRRAGRA